MEIQMRVVRNLLTALTLTLALLIGVAGGAVAHAVMADHHDATPVSTDQGAAVNESQRPCGDCPDRAEPRGMPMATPCCPGLALPMRSEVLHTRSVDCVVWHPSRAHAPAARLIAPEPPPPKSV